MAVKMRLRNMMGAKKNLLLNCNSWMKELRGTENLSIRLGTYNPLTRSFGNKI